MAALLPVGEVWPRDPKSTLMRLVSALCDLVGRWAQRVGTFLLIEAFPPTSLNLLSDWERVLGLPEPCITPPTTIAERQQQVAEKLARRPGGQSRAYFTGIAARLGYHETVPSPYQLPAVLPVQVGRLVQISITEYRPFMFGVSRLGDPRWSFAPHEIRFVWKVNVPGTRVTWFRFGAGGGRLGRDPHSRIARAIDLECLLHKLKPAHTHLIFSYSGV
jgi:uncharacterized protein YmfQ (DUF2313 family)